MQSCLLEGKGSWECLLLKAKDTSRRIDGATGGIGMEAEFLKSGEVFQREGMEPEKDSKAEELCVTENTVIRMCTGRRGLEIP